MANTLTAAIPKLLASGLVTLRQNSIMPRLVNTSYDTLAANEGDTITIPISSTVSVVDVTPGAYATDPGDTTLTSTTITLNNWKEAPFYLTDKDMKEVMTNNVIPDQAAQAIKSLANYVDSAILSEMTNIYGFAGTVGTTPLSSSTTEATQARKVLNKQLAPLDSRRLVMNPDTEAKALDLRAFQDMSFNGSAAAILEGQVNRKLGFDWFMDQNMPTFTTGARAVATYQVDGVHAIGATAITVKTGTGAATVGEQFVIAGDSQVYVVTAAFAGGAGDISISPALKVATAGDELITFKGDASSEYAQDLAFHRDCFAFASRPLADIGADIGGSIIQTAVDAISGITLRLEVRREHKRTRFSFDILFGYKCIRPELGCRIWGAKV